jgi:hypothetical protein
MSDNAQHVYPMNDLKPHKLEGLECPCKPRTQWVNDNLIVIHNSFDGRELLEKKAEGKKQ